MADKVGLEEEAGHCKGVPIPGDGNVHWLARRPIRERPIVEEIFKKRW